MRLVFDIDQQRSNRYSFERSKGGLRFGRPDSSGIPKKKNDLSLNEIVSTVVHQS